jgi:hypothetical protein
MRRCVLDALRNKTSNNPFGLPNDLPKTIIIANIVGETVMFYEHGHTLLYKFLDIVTPQHKRQEVLTGVDQMTTFVKEKTNCLLLMVYSMPPLENASSMHWEIRTVTVENSKVLDGARHFALNTPHPCCANPTADTSEPTLQKAETTALKNHVVAVPVNNTEFQQCVSMQEDKCTSDKSKKQDILRNTITALQIDRNRLLNEISMMKSENETSLQNERTLARREVEKEIAAAQLSKKLAEKYKLDCNSQLTSVHNELKDVKAKLKESTTSMARMELMHSHEIETTRRNRTIYEKEKQVLRIAKERAEKTALETTRSVKTQLENLEFDKQTLCKRIANESQHFKRQEAIRAEMHDKLVACMAGQDAEKDVLKARLEEYTLILHNREDEILKLQNELNTTRVCFKATISEVAALDTDTSLEKQVHITKEMTLKHITHTGQTQTTSTNYTTTGTDTYIDTAQRSKSTQTLNIQPGQQVEPINIMQASEHAFHALQRLVDCAQIPHSPYVITSGVHPPARRSSILKKLSTTR